MIRKNKTNLSKASSYRLDINYMQIHLLLCRFDTECPLTTHTQIIIMDVSPTKRMLEHRTLQQSTAVIRIYKKASSKLG